MKYKLIFKEGFDIVLSGEIETPAEPDYTRRDRQRELLDKKMLEVEMTVNSHTELRLHIEREDK